MNVLITSSTAFSSVDGSEGCADGGGCVLFLLAGPVFCGDVVVLG